jgi:hypothetical protein
MRGIDWIGWIATAIFLLSYRCGTQTRLRLTQAVAALLWVGYGLMLGAVPIVAANLLVAAAAVYTSRPRRPAPQPGSISPAAAQDLSGIS